MLPNNGDVVGLRLIRAEYPSPWLDSAFSPQRTIGMNCRRTLADRLVGSFISGKQNRRGEEVGGIIPHITSSTIANDETSQEEVMVDRPEQQSSITRVTGPFCVEATIPTPVGWEEESPSIQPPPFEGEGVGESYGSFVERMLEVLRKSPVLRLEGNKTVTFKNVRPPAKTLSLSAEAIVDATAPGQKPSLSEAIDEAEEKSGRRLPLSGKSVALVFGPENGAVSEKLVYEAAREAHAKSYTHLYVIGFAIQPNARTLVGKMHRGGRRTRYLRAGHSRFDDGGSAQEYAFQSDLQRLRPAGN